MHSIPLPITSSRLEIRLIQPGDGEIILKYKQENWGELIKWGVWTHHPHIPLRTVKDEEDFCAAQFHKFQKDEGIGLLAVDRWTGEMIGAGGLHNCDWHIRLFTLGFQVHSRKAGQGYGTEIALSLTKYAFEVLDATKVATYHADGNIASQRVIQKTGFVKEGVLRKCHNLWDRGIVDEHHYGLLKGEFQTDLAVTWGL
ncbi:MAG: GNAT family N-acetyltransferase [Alphaproteobacteria bacterium]|nr:GNAT family N-acetyltransferase [Alphaproteobacteria bacterium]